MRRLGILLSLWGLAAALSAGRAAAILGRDARTEGLGGLQAVLQEGPLSLPSNPAALAALSGPQAAFSHQAWLADTHAEDLAYAQPATGGAWALQLGWFGTPAFDNTGGLEAAVDSQLLSVAGGWGGAVAPGLRGGAGLAYQRQSLGSVAVQDLALTIGLDWQSPLPALRAALSLRQLGLWHSDAAGPSSEAVGGLSWTQGALAAGLEFEVPWQGDPGRTRLGLEWHLVPGLALRGGFSGPAAPDQPLVPDLGLGLAWSSLALDWASTQRGPLGTTHAATLRWHFGSAPAPRAQAALADPPAPALAVVPTPSPAPTPHALPKHSHPAAPLPEGFPLSGHPDQGQIALDWQDGLGGKAAGYDVYIGLVPDASMRRLNDALLLSPSYRADVGVRGMTYYFRVKAIGTDGRVLAESRLQAVVMAKELP
jgi:hypothetical protein